MAFKHSDSDNRLGITQLLLGAGRLSRRHYFLLGLISIFVFWNLQKYGNNVIYGIGSHRQDSASFVSGAFWLEWIVFSLFWIGITVRRLNDLHFPTAWALLSLIPFINGILFFILSLLPGADLTARPDAPLPPFMSRLMPKTTFGSALFGAALAPVLGFIALSIYIKVGAQYGWGVFLGLPFCIGLTSVIIYSYSKRRPLGDCLVVSALANVFVAFLILGFAFEGVICLLMATPIACVFGLLGGLLGYVLQKRFSRPQRDHQLVLLAVALSWPLLTGAESQLHLTPSENAVESVMEINAPPETVWNHVVSFSQLPEPTEWVFKTGIAYPIRARIDGRGVGAIRHCIFSTGEFVEPIEVWNEPYQLGFGVKTMPMPMHEWSYKEIHPPHLDGYLEVTHGEFKLTRLPGNRTRLLGTTWYRNRIWPSAYWQTWSDGIIHVVHMRVLKHIKNLSEQADT